MAVVVKRFRVRAGGRTYFPGDVISVLEKKEEKALVDAGYCEYVHEVAKVEPKLDKKVKADKKTRTGEADYNPLVHDEDGPNTSHPLAGEE